MADRAGLLPGPRSGPWLPALAALALMALLGMTTGVDTVPHLELERYHARVRKAEANLPHTVGDWVGADVDVPDAAIEILHPNVLVNRRYTNLRTSETVDVLFVQCSDARDLVGHYPPVCYPAHGLQPGAAEPVDWVVDGVPVAGMRYRFSRDRLTTTSTMVIDNFMVLPTGEIGRDMSDVRRVERDRQLRAFGAAQVQILTTDRMSDDRRNEVFTELVAPMIPLLETLDPEVSRD